MFEERTALITIQETSWSGWDGNGYPIMTSAKLRVTKGSALTPETLGKKKSDYAAVEFLFYEVLVERIVEGWVDFAYRDLVIENPDGTVNLSAAQTGRFILRRGESMKLDTPTMDMGTGVTQAVPRLSQEAVADVASLPGRALSPCTWSRHRMRHF